MAKNNGGPAFPFTPAPQQMLPNGTWDQTYDPGESGMTLRDWFAGMALMFCGNRSYRTQDASVYAKDAYAIADAMITEREKDNA